MYNRNYLADNPFASIFVAKSFKKFLKSNQYEKSLFYFTTPDVLHFSNES